MAHQIPPISASENVLIHVFELDMIASTCGVPICCPGDQPKFKEVHFFPTQLSKLGMEAELKQLMEECRDIFHETGLPIFPCFFVFGLLPCVTICAAHYCGNKRRSRIDDAIKEFNARVQPRGVFVQWNSDFFNWATNRVVREQRNNNTTRIILPTLNPGLEIYVNRERRMQFCREQGIQFEEPLSQLQLPVQQQPPPGSYPPPTLPQQLAVNPNMVTAPPPSYESTQNYKS